MDWNAAIEKNREALKRVLAMLVAMAGPLAPIPSASRPACEPRRTLPRHLHRAVLSLLRPAEAAARRLIIVAARGIVIALPPAGPRKPRPTSTILRNGIGTGIVMPRGFRPSAGPQPPAARTLALPLFDRLPRWNARKRPAASGFPRISIPGLTQPFPVPARPCPTTRSTPRVLPSGLARSAARWTTCRERPGASRAGKRGATGRLRRAAFTVSRRCVPAVRPAGAWRVTIRTRGAAGRTSATSTRSWRTPTRWPATHSAPTRHDAGGCLAEREERRINGQTAGRQRAAWFSLLCRIV